MASAMAGGGHELPANASLHKYSCDVYSRKSQKAMKTLINQQSSVSPTLPHILTSNPQAQLPLTGSVGSAAAAGQQQQQRWQ